MSTSFWIPSLETFEEVDPAVQLQFLTAAVMYFTANLAEFDHRSVAAL